MAGGFMVKSVSCLLRRPGMNAYELFKALHILAFISWMAALFYQPRLYVYHATATPGGELSETLKVMERKLLRYIGNPAMIATLLFGFLLAVQGNWFNPANGGAWLHAKLGLVLLMAGFHGACAKWRKDFAADRNTKSAKFFRVANEVPTVLLIGIVLLAVVKPF